MTDTILSKVKNIIIKRSSFVMKGDRISREIRWCLFFQYYHIPLYVFHPIRHVHLPALQFTYELDVPIDTIMTKSMFLIASIFVFINNY